MEFDKDPDAFADAVEFLVESDCEFELVLLGPRSPRTPEALQRIRDAAGSRIIHDGETPASTYRKLVSDSDIVASTARQEFFGVSVVEAIAAGCRPVLPDRLSYPWLIPQEHHEDVLYQGELGPALREALTESSRLDGLAGSMTRFSWDAVAPVYDTRIESLARV